MADTLIRKTFTCKPLRKSTHVDQLLRNPFTQLPHTGNVVTKTDSSQADDPQAAHGLDISLLTIMKQALALYPVSQK